MTASLILGLISVLQLMASIRLFYLALNQEASERVRQRLTAGQVAPVVEKPGWARLDRAFIRAGLGHPTERVGLALTLYALVVLIGYGLGGGIGAVCALLGVPLMLRLFVSWRYRVRVRRMIEQLPQLLDNSVPQSQIRQNPVRRGAVRHRRRRPAAQGRHEPHRAQRATGGQPAGRRPGFCRTVRKRRVSPVCPGPAGQPSLWRQRQ